MDDNYYNGARLLGMVDLDGQPPEIYICTSNRSAGKTTFFSRLCVRRFLQRDEKFAILYRFRNELDAVEDKFFRDIQALFFPAYRMTSAKLCGGSFRELYLAEGDDEPAACGYAVALNTADTLKKYSHLFSDVARIFFDEFQSENYHYCSHEIDKFISLHTTIARGRGEMVRRVPVIMCSNPVTMINPYYTALGITQRLRPETHFLRGHGWVLEQGYNDAAANAQRGSAFNRAFADANYMAYNTDATYLADDMTFIAPPPDGVGEYFMTIVYNGRYFGLRTYADSGILYTDGRADKTYPIMIAVTDTDHDETAQLLQRNAPALSILRDYYRRGMLRFHDLTAKTAVLALLTQAMLM